MCVSTYVYNARISEGLSDLMAIDTITKIDACNNCLVQLPPGQFMYVCIYICIYKAWYINMYTHIHTYIPDLMAIDTITKIDACNNCLVQLPPG
jgi:hypothetical protein